MNVGAARERTARWVTLTATFFGAGLMRPGPGTWASAATVGLWWALTRMIAPAMRPAAAIALSLTAVAIGIPAATRMARATALKDPQFVVIDEVAGQMIALI